MPITIGRYNFEGPYLLNSWNPPVKSAVYAVMHKNINNQYAVDYVGESENLADRGFPWGHERSDCWIRQAGSKSNVFIALLFTPGYSDDQRKAVEQELIQQFNPACNRE